LLQEEKHTDGDEVEDQVTAFLSEELHKDPPRLDFEEFHGLIRAFSKLADVSAEQASMLTTCGLVDRQCLIEVSVGCHFPKPSMLESCESRRTAKPL